MGGVGMRNSNNLKFEDMKNLSDNVVSYAYLLKKIDRFREDLEHYRELDERGKDVRKQIEGAESGIKNITQAIEIDARVFYLMSKIRNGDKSQETQNEFGKLYELMTEWEFRIEYP